MFILVEITQGGRERERKYERSRILLGADLRCQVWIPESGAAPEHVEISEREGRLHLRTLPGAAPVRVNGADSVETPLADGDRIGIGTAEFRVRGPYRRNAVRIPWRTLAWASAVLLAAWIAIEKIPLGRAPAATPGPAVPPDRAALPVPEAIPAPPAPEPAPAAEPDPDDRAQRVLAYAQSRIAQGQLEEADKILSGLQAENAGFLPAYSERATLFEKRGDSAQARAQWMEILRRAQDAESPETHRAASELSRMAMEEFPRYTPPPAPRVPRVNPTAAGVPTEKVSVVSAEVRRLPPSRDADDVRILEIRMELSADSPPVPLEEVSVVVRFYDRTDPDGRVRPSSIRNNPQTRSPGPGIWTPGTPLQVTAAYVLPQGARAQDARAYGGKTAYYGYTLEVRVGKQVRARLIRPAQLEHAIYGRR